MDTQKVGYMQEHSTKQVKNAQPTPPTGQVNINAAREGLAMVMDGLRVMEQARAKVSKASILFDGKILLLPVIEITGHTIGIMVMEKVVDGKTVTERVFTTDGISVMEAA
jgi:hypothetical protein